MAQNTHRIGAISTIICKHCSISLALIRRKKMMIRTQRNYWVELNQIKHLCLYTHDIIVYILPTIMYFLNSSINTWLPQYDLLKPDLFPICHFESREVWEKSSYYVKGFLTDCHWWSSHKIISLLIDFWQSLVCLWSLTQLNSADKASCQCLGHSQIIVWQ